jgi:hypothetical protein
MQPQPTSRIAAAVPTFFFNLYDDMIVMDPEGKELADPPAAHDKAVETARHLACAEVLEGRLGLKHRIEVADERGDVIDTVRFGDVITIDGAGA